MLYKIESIKHSRGTLKGLDRQDDRYPMRIGRIISLDIDDILIDFPLIIKYVRDSDGTPMRKLVLRTRFVKLIIAYWHLFTSFLYNHHI